MNHRQQLQENVKKYNENREKYFQELKQKAQEEALEYYNDTLYEELTERSEAGYTNYEIKSSAVNSNPMISNRDLEQSFFGEELETILLQNGFTLSTEKPKPLMLNVWYFNISWE